MKNTLTPIEAMGARAMQIVAENHPERFSYDGHNIFLDGLSIGYALTEALHPNTRTALMDRSATGSCAKNLKPENLTRALAILTTEPDEWDIALKARYVCVAGQELEHGDEDDDQVLAILMSYKEFGFAVGAFEEASASLRAMQKVWLAAAEKMKQEAA